MPTLLEALDAAAEPDGFVRFDRFVELALYHPELGYYARPGQIFGKEGDFYTAPRVAPVFGGALGDRLLELWGRSGRPPAYRIVELGPGDGQLAVDVLAAVDPRLPDGADWVYTVVERSGRLRSSVESRLRALELRHVRVRSTDALATEGTFDGVVIANELFDALPPRRLRAREGSWVELGVRRRGEELEPAERPVRPAERPPRLPSDAVEGATYEFAPQGEALLRQMADQLRSGGVILLDYGEDEALWTRRPSEGTLAAIRGHRETGTPLAAPGEHDLSVFVNFTRLRAAARDAGFVELAYRPQAEALTAWGLEARARAYLADAATSEEAVRRQLAVKNLLFGFGNFRVLELSTREVPASAPRAAA